MVPIRMISLNPLPEEILAAFIVLSLRGAFPEARQPLHLLEQKLKIG